MSLFESQEREDREFISAMEEERRYKAKGRLPVPYRCSVHAVFPSCDAPDPDPLCCACQEQALPDLCRTCGKRNCFQLRRCTG